MSDLVARINTKDKFESIETTEDMKKEMGLYTKFEGKQAEIYRGGDFRKLINYIVDKGVQSENEDDKSIATDVKNMLAEQDPAQKPFEVYIYDLSTKEFVRNVNDAEMAAMALEEKIRPYLKHTTVQSEDGTERELEYIDLVVRLDYKIGCKPA
ncbi:MAG: hypothetical protein Q8O03_03905 [Nanoarchaeota archaeon]|nr:hypothetical protein [Nanoarchaeota archaeon]